MLDFAEFGRFNKKNSASAKEALHETMGTCSVLTAYKIVNYISKKSPLVQTTCLEKLSVLILVEPPLTFP